MNNVIVKHLNLFQLGLKNAVCIGYQEEKTLMSDNGEHHANVTIHMRITILTLKNAICVLNAFVFNLILLVYHVINHGKTIKLYLRQNKKDI